MLVLHALFIAFAVFGGMLTYRKSHGLPYTWPAQLGPPPLSSWAGLTPTPLEQQLRSAAGQQGYTTSFIEHNLLAVTYSHGLTRGVQIALGAGVVVFNAVVYGVLMLKLGRSSIKTGVSCY